MYIEYQATKKISLLLSLLLVGCVSTSSGHLTKGVEQFRKGDYSAVLAESNQAIAADPNSPYGYN